MKLASALIAVLAVCQLQYSTAARLRNNAEFLPNVGNLIDKVKDRLQKEGSLRDEIVKQYLDNLEEQYENLKNSGEDIEASAKDAVEDMLEDLGNSAGNVGDKLKKLFG